MINTYLKSEIAKSHAMGFVANQVVSPTNIPVRSQLGESYEFCLREILIDGSSQSCINNPTNAEILALMNGISGSNGVKGEQGVAVMLYTKAWIDSTKLPSTGTDTSTSEDDKSDIDQLALQNVALLISKVRELILPYNISIWLDESSLDEPTAISSLKSLSSAEVSQIKQIYKASWEKYIQQAGYVPGFWSSSPDSSSTTPSNSGDFLEPTKDPNSQTPATPVSSSLFKTISIGENSGSNEIRWALLD